MTQRLDDRTDLGSQDQSSTTKQDLSKSVFDDPKTFLNILKDNIHKVPQSVPGLVSKNDLEIYSQKNNDDLAKAARIVVNHWDEFRSLSRIPNIVGRDYQNSHEREGKPIDALTKNDLAISLSMYENQTGYYVAKNLAKGVPITMGFALVTALSAGATFLSLETPPAAIAVGLVTVAQGAYTADAAYSTAMSYSRIRSLAERNREVLHSWPEINSVRNRQMIQRDNPMNSQQSFPRQDQFRTKEVF